MEELNDAPVARLPRPVRVHRICSQQITARLSLIAERHITRHSIEKNEHRELLLVRKA